jgi:hypothetical protein
MNHILQHRAYAAKAEIESARTPLQKHRARQEGLAVKADLEKQIGDDKALAVFKAARPQSAFGVWKGAPVHDHPAFMTGPVGTKITGPINLPDGTKAEPNPQGQIAVPMAMVPAMMSRGFVRANSVITHPDGSRDDPARPNV